MSSYWYPEGAAGRYVEEHYLREEEYEEEQHDVVCGCTPCKQREAAMSPERRQRRRELRRWINEKG